MEPISYNTALIVGAGMGLSAALTRLFTSKNINVALAARRLTSLPRFAKKPGRSPTHVMRPRWMT